METSIIITICALLLLAYVFDLTSSKTKVPSVILLLLLGWFVKQVSLRLNINIPDLTQLLPILGTIGLILIVLEGSLELELNKSNAPLIKKSLLVAFFPMFILAFTLTFIFQYLSEASFKNSLINAIPFCVISSAIAIPSVQYLHRSNREFIIYESSLSDIIGVLFFNFIVVNDSFGLYSLGHFSLQLVLILVVSFIATIGLAILFSRIDHHIKFAPIIFIIILIYAVSKIYHLPGLIFILFFGLFLGNLDELKHIKWIKRLKPDELDEEVVKFKEFNVEASFLIRALFFILFGYLIETSELFNTSTLFLAAIIAILIFSIRALFLMISKLPLSPLLFIAPRGLITILLFLAITPSHSIFFVNKSLIIQVIIITAFIMMLGIMTNKVVKEVKQTMEKD